MTEITPNWTQHVARLKREAEEADMNMTLKKERFAQEQQKAKKKKRVEEAKKKVEEAKKRVEEAKKNVGQKGGKKKDGKKANVREEL